MDQRGLREGAGHPEVLSMKTHPAVQFLFAHFFSESVTPPITV